MGSSSRPAGRRVIHQYSNGILQTREDDLTPEAPLQIQLLSTRGSAPRTVAITMRTPGRDTYLALGFLFTEGVIERPSEVASAQQRGRATADDRNTVVVQLAPGVGVDWKRLERHSYTSSSCGVCGKTALDHVHAALPYPDSMKQWRVSPQTVLTAPRTLREAQTMFDKTGSIHAAGLLNLKGEMTHCAEDVGRHNALDKVIGRAFIEDRLPLDEQLLVLSGRASFELIQKAAMAGIQFVIAVGAPSTLAVDLAEDQGMTLCGFVKRGGFNCYCGSERLQP